MTSISLLADNHGGSGLASFIIFIPFLAAIYFLMIRPQRRRQRDAIAMQKSIEVGDEVMTTAGVYGFVTGFDGDVAWLEIDDNVQIRIARQALQRKVDTAVGETAVPTAGDLPASGSKSRHTKMGDVAVTESSDAPRDDAD